MDILRDFEFNTSEVLISGDKADRGETLCHPRPPATCKSLFNISLRVGLTHRESPLELLPLFEVLYLCNFVQPTFASRIKPTMSEKVKGRGRLVPAQATGVEYKV